MNLYVIKIHGKNEIYGEQDEVWYIPDISKKGYCWTPTVLTNERKKKAKKITIQEILLKYTIKG